MDTYTVLQLAPLLLILSLPLCFGQTNEAQFNQKEDLTLMAGETATLLCSIYNPVGYKVSWYFDDLKRYISYVLTRNKHRFINDARYNVRHHTGTGTQSPYYDHYDLTIENLTYDDQGQYRCVHLSVNFPTIKTVNLTIQDASAHGVTSRSTHSVSETTGIRTSSATSRPIHDETTTDVDTSSARKKVSNEAAKVTRQEFYRDQMVTNMLWRKMMKREHTFYDYIKRILDEREH